ncbi:Transposase InsO and inactivated derivatives [Ectothiorhodospira mobilis]|uniref:Transposase InsO and inactivated derivatives n=1 Tax=Ectothiorhodospira mobilis TaxID=195064 RepID=A0A1I4SBA8_ECTMO|nr:Transposase InsO and inactivated derivatives [Ectothiorhodospira mobilis]
MKPSCEVLGISARTYQRWQREAEVPSDGRSTAVRPKPAHALSEAEEQTVLALCNRPEYQDLPPAQIVAQEADAGRYWALESTLYRVLRKHKQAQPRGRGRKGPTPPLPTSHRADGPNQVWSWATTWLPGPVVGLFFYLTLIIDLYSRKIVGWEVETRESSELAVQVLEQALLKEQCFNQPLVLHSDNGSPFKGATLRARLTALKIEPSYSRPRVSNDNPFSESLFATCKAMPAYPANGFESLEAARVWVHRFVQWYNHEHRHSGIQYVTPVERHNGDDAAILAGRHQVYVEAKARNPRRWSREIRDWRPVGAVHLNPEKETQGSDLTRAA